MNTNESFEQLIQEDKTLSTIFIDGEIPSDMDFSQTQYSEDFKQYIAVRYVDDFQDVYEDHIHTETKEDLVSLIKSVEALSTVEAREQIIKILLPELERVARDLETFSDFVIDETLLIQQKHLFDASLTPLTVTILNQFDDDESVEKLKESILVSCVGISNSLASAKPKSYPVKTAVYKTVMSSLDEIQHDRNLTTLFRKYKMKEKERNPSANLAVYWIVFVTAFFIIVRILIRVYRISFW